MPILTDQERLGTTIGDGRYRLDSVLGRGGMGTVFEALHEWTGRRVAVKLLRHDVAADLDASQRFLQEARSATAIEHPNVVEVLDMGRHDEWTVYMVFELLRGESLADRLDTVGRLEPMEAMMILLPVADALAAAHRLGIVHRDLKPDNIFLEDDGMGYIRPKLLDFGIARPMDREGGEVRTGVIAGTPEYLSPEHAQGFRAGPASDVWSLGVVLYECITGNRPFEGDGVLSVLVAITTQPIPSLREFPDVPASIADVLDGALVRDPAARIPDGKGFRDALAAASQVEFVPSRSRSVPPKILRDSGEIALSRAHRVEKRQSSPSLAAMPPTWMPTPVPARLSTPSSGLAAHVVDPRIVPTLDDISQIIAATRESERVRARRARRNPSSVALFGLLVFVVFVFGYRATQFVEARVLAPGADDTDVRSGLTASASDSDAPAGLEVESEVASAALSDDSSFDAADADALTRMPARDRPAGDPVISPRAGVSTPPASTEPAERRPRRSQSATRPGVQRGANGSLILD